MRLDPFRSGLLSSSACEQYKLPSKTLIRNYAKVRRIYACKPVGAWKNTYMEDYELSPDELIAKAFRVIQSRRDAYQRTVKANGSPRFKSFIGKKETETLDTPRCAAKTRFLCLLPQSDLAGVFAAEHSSRFLRLTGTGQGQRCFSRNQ